MTGLRTCASLCCHTNVRLVTGAFVLQNNGTCTDYVAPALTAPPVKQGQYCDVGQIPQMGCGYCNLMYQYVGGPLTTCAANVTSLLPHIVCHIRQCLVIPSVGTTALVEVDDESSRTTMFVDSHAAWLKCLSV